MNVFSKISQRSSLHTVETILINLSKKVKIPLARKFYFVVLKKTNKTGSTKNTERMEIVKFYNFWTELGIHKQGFKSDLNF